MNKINRRLFCHIHFWVIIDKTQWSLSIVYLVWNLYLDCQAENSSLPLSLTVVNQQIHVHSYENFDCKGSNMWFNEFNPNSLYNCLDKQIHWSLSMSSIMFWGRCNGPSLGKVHRWMNDIDTWKGVDFFCEKNHGPKKMSVFVEAVNNACENLESTESSWLLFCSGNVVWLNSDGPD